MKNTERTYSPVFQRNQKVRIKATGATGRIADMAGRKFLVCVIVGEFHGWTWCYANEIDPCAS